MNTDSRTGLPVSVLPASGLPASVLASVVADLPAAALGVAFFGFPILSAGSGGTELFSSSMAVPPAPPLALPFALGLALAVPFAAEEAVAGAPSSDSEGDPPDPVRDDDIVLLSATESPLSASGSVSRTGGAIMNGIRVVGLAASSTPSSSVLTDHLRTFA